MLTRTTFLLSALLTASCGGNVSVGGSGGAASTSSGPASTTSTSATSTTATTSSASATSSTSSGGTCAPSCTLGFSCCGAQCDNLDNDIKNCGACGVACPQPFPFCDKGVCGKAACSIGPCPLQSDHCCGTKCCAAGELCCNIPGPIGDMLSCVAPDAEGTCPLGCKSCKCASPDTLIATPQGQRPIAELRVGDVVYSVGERGIVAVPIRAVNHTPAPHHFVPRITLASGAVLEISAGHPTADGRTFGELAAGQTLDGIAIVRVEGIAYRHAYTYDILPDSPTGAYFAAGVLIGSTLAEAAQVCLQPR